MAKRFYFNISLEKPYYVETEVDFIYYSGFSKSQKHKSISSMHKSINDHKPDLSILEISTSSMQEIGRRLSAFNLKYFDKKSNKIYSVENIFQSSKIFENGGPFTDILCLTPLEAKKDDRLKNSGRLIGFNFQGEKFDIKPTTYFYDWIYINALHQQKALTNDILKFDTFTDIEFNHKKSFNCQARSAAIFVSLLRQDKLSQMLDDISSFKEIYSEKIELNNQLSLF